MNTPASYKRMSHFRKRILSVYMKWPRMCHVIKTLDVVVLFVQSHDSTLTVVLPLILLLLRFRRRADEVVDVANLTPNHIFLSTAMTNKATRQATFRFALQIIYLPESINDFSIAFFCCEIVGLMTLLRDYQNTLSSFSSQPVDSQQTCHCHHM